jgi:hypothetical protein
MMSDSRRVRRLSDWMAMSMLISMRRVHDSYSRIFSRKKNSPLTKTEKVVGIDIPFSSEKKDYPAINNRNKGEDKARPSIFSEERSDGINTGKYKPQKYTKKNDKWRFIVGRNTREKNRYDEY